MTEQTMLPLVFMLRGRDTHIDFLRLLCLVGMIDDLPSDARAFSLTSFETQSSSLRILP